MGKLSNSSDNAVDTEGRILEAYVNQCTAEAQEGIINLFTIFTYHNKHSLNSFLNTKKSLKIPK